MKTFKVITLQVVENDDLKDIEIVDGLIINKEDEKGTWLIEGCMKKEYYDFFRDAQQEEDDLEVQVVISHPDNDPAAFMTRISCIKSMDFNLSILFEGKLKKQRNEYAELLLDDLVEKGFQGTGLVQEFKDKMKSKPRLAVASKTSN
ncbi:YwpF family protein [Bacillus sp. AK031]